MEHKVEQRSDEWYKIRCGKLTASMYQDIMKKPNARKDWTEGQLAILRKVVAERLTGIPVTVPVTAATQHGIDNEDMARHRFQVETFETVRECGFFERDEWTGASPDGIITRDGEDYAVFEVKCPSSKNHLLYMLYPDMLIEAYLGQLLGECLATGLNKATIISYDPRFLDENKQLVIAEMDVPSSVLARMADRLGEAVELMEDWV